MSLYDRVIGEASDFLAEMGLQKLKRIGPDRRSASHHAQMQRKIGTSNFRYSQTHEAPRGTPDHAAGVARTSIHKASRGQRKARGA